uniref:TBC1 domain family, member 25 n=1 Tax=Tetraodon nigroviridis TaxID=99883 RepID=H3CDN8_TETNG
ACSMASEEEREVVRVRVQKCDGSLPVEFRSFAVDPQITSLEVLQHILIRAFDLNGRRSFGVSFLSRDRSGAEMYLSLASDWDLDVAFLSAAKPYLQLKMDVKSSEDSPVLEDWDIISTKDVIGSEQQLVERTKTLASAALPFTQSILSQVGRTLSRVQQALSWSYEEEMKPLMPPLSDAEFHSFLNGQGQLTRPEELRLRIYHGGVEPSLRKVVWRYLLNVYPDGLSGQERMDYMKRKTRQYEQLKREWRAHVSVEDLEFIRGNVLKDVLRTDRSHPYYAGSEDSPHLVALTDLLTTFAITHPQISYCQGMSDLASPILAVMDNEAHAFICFCGIMKRLGGNFRPDGQLMSLKFQHLKLLLQHSDPEFYSYLVSRGADDLFFLYRWLLLELKREFAFDDARMLEITWSSLPPDPPETEVELLGPPSEAQGGHDQEGRSREARRRMLRPLREELDRSGAGRRDGPDGGGTAGVLERQASFGTVATARLRPPPLCPPGPAGLESGLPPGLAGRLPRRPSELPQSGPQGVDLAQSGPLLAHRPRLEEIRVAGLRAEPVPTPCWLPPPQEFGRGNPFMLFLCLSILLEHRDHIIKNCLDYNELAMHFDRLVRRHNLARVLQRAKALFADYLQSEIWDSEEGDEAGSDS